MYEIQIQPANKKFFIKAAGFFQKPEAERFIQELEQKIKTINPREYDLVIDAREQKPSGPDVVELQKKAMDIYLKTPFRSRRSVEFNSSVTKVQIKRLGQEELLSKFTFHETLEEAMK